MSDEQDRTRQRAERLATVDSPSGRIRIIVDDVGGFIVTIDGVLRAKGPSADDTLHNALENLAGQARGQGGAALAAGDIAGARTAALLIEELDEAARNWRRIVGKAKAPPV